MRRSSTTFQPSPIRLLQVLLAAAATLPAIGQAQGGIDDGMAFANAEAQGRIGIYDLQTGRFYVPLSESDSDVRLEAPDDTVPPNARNLPPVATKDAAKTDAGVAKRVNVLRNDSDPEGKPLKVSAVGTPDAGGKVRIVDTGGAVRYTPKAGFVGKEHFAYTVSDGLKTASATVTVTVAAAGGDPIDCTPIQNEIKGSGGCWLTLTAPANCATVPSTYSSIEIDWTTHTTFCESPQHILIVGHPAAGSQIWDIQINETNGEFHSISASGSGYAMTRNIGGYLILKKADMQTIQASLPSSNGQYHFAVRGFYAIDNGGSISASRTLVFQP